MAPRKRDTKCNACGLKGHWAGDPECNLINLDASEFEIFLANVGKEPNWSRMGEEERKLDQAAALEQREKWVEKQSNTIRSEIKAQPAHSTIRAS